MRTLDDSHQQLQATYAEVQRFGEQAFDRIGSSITDMAVQGKEAMVTLGSVARAMSSEIAQEFMRLALLTPIKNALFGGNNPTFADMGGLFGKAVSGIGKLFAKGDSFQAPSATLHQHVNSVVATPTLFAFAQGAGLMGEAGPEAIMPLVRMPSGDLGVRAAGGGGVTSIVNVNLGGGTDGDSSSGKGFGNIVTKPGNDAQGLALGRTIETAVRGVLMNEMRPGGMLNQSGMG